MAKIDMRLMSDMAAAEALAARKAHLAKHGYGDIDATQRSRAATKTRIFMERSHPRLRG